MRNTVEKINHTFFFAVLAAFPLLCAGEIFAQTSLVSFRTITVQSGVPEFKPIQNRIPFQAFSATIPLPDSLGAAYLCYGLDREKNFVLYQMNRRTDGKTTITGIPLVESNADTLYSVIDFALLPGQTLNYPFEFTIIRSKGTLSYRWPLSRHPTVPGGVPTPLEQLINVGKPLPPFALKTLDDRTIRSSDLRSKIHVINWWGTWCGACVVEIPGFNKLVDEFGSTVGFVAIAQNTPQEVKTFIEKRPFHFLQTLATDAAIALFGGAAPRTIVLNQKGEVVFDEHGGGPERYLDIRKIILETQGNKQ